MRKSHAPDEPAGAKRAWLNEKTRKFQKAFGAVLGELMDANKLTQEDLGKIAERDQTTMSNAKGGKNFPRLQAIIKIADRFGLPIWELFRQAQPKYEKLLAEAAKGAPPPSPPFGKRLAETGKAPRRTKHSDEKGITPSKPTRKKEL